MNYIYLLSVFSLSLHCQIYVQTHRDMQHQLDLASDPKRYLEHFPERMDFGRDDQAPYPAAVCIVAANIPSEAKLPCR